MFAVLSDVNSGQVLVEEAPGSKTTWPKLFGDRLFGDRLFGDRVRSTGSGAGLARLIYVQIYDPEK